MMDAKSEKTHITPIFWDLFTRQYLPQAELQLLEHLLYPARGYQMTRPGLAGSMRLLSLCLGGDCLYGDNHITRSRREWQRHGFPIKVKDPA